MTDRYVTPSHFMPYPELLAATAEPYEILDSSEVRGLPTNGMVDQVNRVMLVPFDAPGLLVSRHECAHVMWSPERMTKGAEYIGYLQAVEDGRINSGLREIGLGIDLDAEQLSQVIQLGKKDLEHGPIGLVYWALRAVASHGTSVARPLLALVDEDSDSTPALPIFPAARVRDLVVRTHRKLDAARDRDGGPVASFETGSLIARWLRRELLDLDLPEPQNDSGFVCCIAAGLAVPGSKGRPLHRDLRPTERRLLEGLGAGSGGPGAGRMKIAEPALPHACAPPPRGSARGRRYSAEGTVLRDISRFSHDQKVFGVKAPRRRGGGSVLIDQSGSMSLEAKDVDRLIAGAPEATLVAVYSGRGAEGELRIVVRDGYRAAAKDLEPFGTSNVIDLPAMEWLAKQPKPLVLISDGGFTGIGDKPSRKVRMGCERVAKRAGIVRVEDADAAARELARHRR